MAKTHPSPRPTSDLPRHRAIYEELLREIKGGVYPAGGRLPSEAALCERFDASRITVAKAIQTLQRDRLVTRRPGSGTYIESPPVSSSLQFGLIIPDFGRTEIFEPICQGMMRSPLGKSNSLLWGHSASPGEDSEQATHQLCRQYIAQKVSGVFFAPLEFTPKRDCINRRVVAALTQANIPIVLLDRCFETYPGRSPFDLVGVDNHRAGYLLTRHLQRHGACRILFVARPESASTVDGRIAGYYDALRNHPNHAAPGHASTDRSRQEWTGVVSRIDVSDVSLVSSVLETNRPDAIICANDLTAAHLMKTLDGLGIAIPDEIRIVGMDDVNYANFLSVPLTTIRQDCAEIGAVAMSTMLERLERPDRPARDVLVHFNLVVRQSCGAHPLKT